MATNPKSSPPPHRPIVIVEVGNDKGPAEIKQLKRGRVGVDWKFRAAKGEQGQLVIHSVESHGEAVTLPFRIDDTTQSGETQTLFLSCGPPLTSDLGDLIAHLYKPALLARHTLVDHDLKEVKEEIRAIQNCRSGIFIATIGAVAGSAASTVLLVSQWLRTDNPGLIPYSLAAIGMLVTLSLLTIGIFATIEKARAINVRKGFLLAVESSLKHGRYPENYEGWAQLSTQSYPECGVLQRAGLCGVLKEENVSAKSSEKVLRTVRCWERGSQDAKEILQEKQLLVGTFASFTAFSTLIYTALYLCCFVAIIIAGQQLAAAVKIGWKNYFFLGAVGTCFGALAAAILFFVRADLRDPGRRSNAQWFSYILAAIASVAVLIALAISLFMDPSYGSVARIVSAGVAVAGGTIAWLAVFLQWQLQLCRRGKHSIEAYRFGWDRALSKCHFDLYSLSYSAKK